ncbi:MAG: M14 family metallopeptidase [Polyangiaceae bacterium]
MSIPSPSVLRHDRADPLASLDDAIARAEAGPLPAWSVGARYRPYASWLRQIRALAIPSAEFRLLRYGRSVEGEPLFALDVGEVTARGRAAVVLAGVHPNEWIGVEAAFALLERLRGSARWLGADRAVGRRALVFPIVNPDGIRRVEANLRAGARRFVRHNARGVDLNRNFDASWGRLGFGQRLLGRLFRPGSRPASEPEIESIAHALSGMRVDRAASLHSFGGAVLYPSASSWRPIPDRDEHRAWADRIARAAGRGRPYAALSCARFAWGFRAGGLELDWFHERHGALSLLVECSRGGFGWPLARARDPFAWFNPKDPRADASAVAGALEPFVLGMPP